jgi:peptide subunit release factor 1 (eRF1)
VAELATQVFITSDRPNVVGLILAGSAEFKNTLNGSQLFDPRLQGIVQKLVDVSYGPSHTRAQPHVSRCQLRILCSPPFLLLL